MTNTSSNGNGHRIFEIGPGGSTHFTVILELPRRRGGGGGQFLTTKVYTLLLLLELKNKHSRMFAAVLDAGIAAIYWLAKLTVT